MTYDIVIPGEVVGKTAGTRGGVNTYTDGEDILALKLGIKRNRRDRVDVVALGGRYDPSPGDLIVGTVVETGPSNWYIEVGAFTDIGMHVNEVPWRVEFGETAKFLDIGEAVILKVYHVDELKKAQVTMKDRACRKLTGGTIIEVEPVKVPRIIGAKNSMLDLLKDRTDCRIFVGRNGRIWVDGEPERLEVLADAIRLIEREAHMSGLTNRVKEYLDDRIGPDEHRASSEEE